MIRAALKLFFLLAWGALWVLPTWLFKTLNKTMWRDWCVKVCSRGLLVIGGIRLSVGGHAGVARPMLMVSNHLSYFDVPMLAGHVSLRFTPKSEIAGWPVIATICRITDAIFVDRRPEKVKEVRQSLHDALARGNVVALFPEATTGNGLHVLPFKSGFFSLAEESFDGRELTIQPVALTYTRINRLPIDTTQWPLVAWYGDMALVPHLWNFLKLGAVDAELAFLPPVTLSQCGDRKKLAAHCHRLISEHLVRMRQNKNNQM